MNLELIYYGHEIFRNELSFVTDEMIYSDFVDFMFALWKSHQIHFAST